MSIPDFLQHRPSAKQSALEQGKYAEELVARWLMGQGWKILYRRWRCRWGELDLVATLPNPQTRLAFIEVKARSKGNWDADGLLAITPQKQAKLWRAAEAFLAEHPYWAEVPCQFDVALVACQKAHVSGIDQPESRADLVVVPGDKVQIGEVQLGKAVAIAHHRLTLQQYIPNAFS